MTAWREICTDARPRKSPMTSFLVSAGHLSVRAVEVILGLKMLNEKDWTAPDTHRLLNGCTLLERMDEADDDDSLEVEFSASWGENRTNEQHRFTSGTAMSHSTLEYG